MRFVFDLPICVELTFFLGRVEDLLSRGLNAQRISFIPLYDSHRVVLNLIYRFTTYGFELNLFRLSWTRRFIGFMLRQSISRCLVKHLGTSMICVQLERAMFVFFIAT